MKAFFPDPAEPGSPGYEAAEYIYDAVASGKEPEQAIAEAELIFFDRNVWGDTMTEPEGKKDHGLVPSSVHGECNQCGLCCIISHRSKKLPHYELLNDPANRRMQETYNYNAMREGLMVVKDDGATIWMAKFDICPLLDIRGGGEPIHPKERGTMNFELNRLRKGIHMDLDKVRAFIRGKMPHRLCSVFGTDKRPPTCVNFPNFEAGEFEICNVLAPDGCGYTFRPDPPDGWNPADEEREKAYGRVYEKAIEAGRTVPEAEAIVAAMRKADAPPELEE